MGYWDGGVPFCSCKKEPKKHAKGRTKWFAFGIHSFFTRGLLRIVQEVRLSRSYAAGINGQEPKLC